MLCYLCLRKKVYETVNYLDDLAGCDVPTLSNAAFVCLGEVLADCGLQESLGEVLSTSDFNGIFGCSH